MLSSTVLPYPDMQNCFFSLLFLDIEIYHLQMEVSVIDEQSHQGRVCPRTSPTKHRIYKRKLQVSWGNLAHWWKVGGTNGPIFRQKVILIFPYISSLHFLFQLPVS
jgi:hypothetical protein